MDRLLMKLEYDRGGEDDSMRAAHSRGFTVNISKFPSTQVAHDDTKTDAQHSTRRTTENPAASEMRKRLIQIFGFLLTSLGWVFVLCTIAMDYWRITQLGGQGGSFIIKVAWYWSNLWKDCFTDSTAVTNCRDFPVLWAVTPFVQGVRGLLMCGITLGFFAVVLCFIGMECTYIGGAEKLKDKLVFAGAVLHFVGGISNIAGYCLYINRIARTTFAPSVGPGVLRYDLGPPIFLGLVGCFLIFLGAVFYAVTVCYVLRRESQVVYANGGGTYMYPRTRGLYSGYYRPSRLYGTYMGSRLSSSSKISKISQTTPTKVSERDAFV
ncbi:claudin 10-like 2 [Takifugu rubripes]|uniref:Claudin-10-like n=1 Tax=Takifugu rubripes TaxID=31033 RepID=A0A674MR02_TAKRU|nr:claudin-10-like [Takifugu rubripes]|eukprot:XP_003961933.1 PREDICTED: claudin-10-like [Takifugu rubripes]